MPNLDEDFNAVRYGGRESKFVTWAGRPSVMAVIDGADMAPDDDFYIGAAVNARDHETYIHARRLA
jgi:hypothetical protein